MAFSIPLHFTRNGDVDRGSGIEKLSLRPLARSALSAIEPAQGGFLLFVVQFTIR